MAKKRRRKTKKQKAWAFLKVQFVLIGIVVTAILYYYIGGYAKQVSDMHAEAVQFVKESTEDTFRRTQTSVAYDADGNVISVLKGEKDVYYVQLKDIPEYTQEAIISIEDKKFYSHHGVDYRAIVRAVWAMIRNREITQGASTITQQLARNIFLTQEKTWQRKIEEIYIAVELEKKYTKAQILEFYLNNIYFANGYYGIQAAAQGYFGKDVAQLSLSQQAFLCAIPNNPSYYDPEKHPDHTKKRRNRILKNMLEDGMIREESYDEAVAEDITLVQTAQEKHDYLETYLDYCATRALMSLQGFEFKTDFSSDAEQEEYESKYDEMYSSCNADLFVGGYRIYTSFDMNMQNTLQSTLDSELSANTETGENGVFALQGAAVCIDNDTGLVKAIVGGRSQDLSGYTLNRAFQSYRQPGSAIKPLIVYTPVLERGYTADTMVNDVKTADGPENAGGSYSGRITLRRAVELSRNTVAYDLFTNVLTPAVGLQYLKDMNFAKVSSADEHPAAALGGFSTGVSPLEMAKAYATLENDGAYREPSCITKITDADGNELYTPDRTETIIYQTDAARAMTDILEGVLTKGTAAGLGISETEGAAKTGTTNGSKDGWFCGYTAYYTTAVWVGYDTPRTLDGLAGSTYPGRIWHDFMETIHTGLASRSLITTPVASGDMQSEQ